MTTDARYRIALQISVADPYWVQVREAVLRQAPHVNCELLTLSTAADGLREVSNAVQIYEELQVQNIHAVICNSIDQTLSSMLRSRAVPVVDASESTINDHLYTSRRGMYDAAYDIGTWLHGRIAPTATVLVVGGFDEMGVSRLGGIRAALSVSPAVSVVHVSCEWRYDDGYRAVADWARTHPAHECAAVVGLSDSLALGGRDALHDAFPERQRPLVCGINGDPLALADISRGRMDVTIETVLDSFAADMLHLALLGIKTGSVPTTYDPQRRLIDAHNVGAIALEKLISLADLPTRLVGVNRQREQERVRQLETSLAITQHVGSILEHDELMRAVATLIRENYGYDAVTLWRFDSDGNLSSTTAPTIPLRGTPLAAALIEERAIYIPDTRFSMRFNQRVHQTNTRTRLVLPVRCTGSITGLLDLQNTTLLPHISGEIEGLQLVANQIGIALQNIDLYQAARKAQFVAEQADSLKTRLLANVSHELRTPLHIILGYSQLLITDSAPHGVEIGAAVRNDIVTIQRSAEHLVLLINDLLDISRAEIDELLLFPEQTDINQLMRELFTELMTTFFKPGLTWHIDIPDPLPIIQVDPTRMRQILFNLLGNAAKFTSNGSIVLGAQSEPPYVHIWVQDTGIGIAPAQQEVIFEPFVTLTDADTSYGGVGLGLAITRRLIALHRGILTVESDLGRGSTFHVYLPVHGLDGEFAPPHQSQLPAAIVVLGDGAAVPVAVQNMAQRSGAAVVHIPAVATLEALLTRVAPLALVWDTTQPFHQERAVIERIQVHPVLAHIPFFVYDSTDRRNTVPIVQKPFQREQLSNTLVFVQPHTTGKTPHIVVIDDDPRMHVLYREMIERALPNAIITACFDGSELAHHLQTNPAPTMFLLDLVMPIQDGFATLAWIRSQPQYARVPVIVLSGKVLTRAEVQKLQYAQTVLRPKLGNTYQGMADLLDQIMSSGLANPPHLSTAARHALAYMQQHYAERLSRERIASEAGVSESYLTQVFQNELGVTPWTYLARYRIAKACQALRTNDESIADIAISVGFDDPGYFSKVFRSEVGMSPREYRSSTHDVGEHVPFRMPESGEVRD